jgi:hypothetical protein
MCCRAAALQREGKVLISDDVVRIVAEDFENMTIFVVCLCGCTAWVRPPCEPASLLQ